MRIKEEIKNVGYFWLPSAPENRIPGFLIIKDGGKIELEVVGHFNESIEGLKSVLNGTDEIERIVGHIEKHGLVTLDDCFYKNKNISFGGISKSTIHVNQAFFGVAYDDKEIVSFNSFQFSVEGVDEWVGLSGIKVENDYESRTATITYVPPSEISFNLKNGMELRLTFSWSFPGFPHNREAKVSQKTYFRLISEKELPLNEFISAAYKITTLLCFAIDKTVCIEQISATSDSITRDIGEVKNVPVSVSIYYGSLPYSKIQPKIDWHRMLFRFGQIADDAERIINNWFDAYGEIDPALNLYFSTKTDAYKYLEGKFLALAQALETYHRRTSGERLMDDAVFKELTERLLEQCPEERRAWLAGRIAHGNEISLSRRIKSIIEPFKEILGNSKDRGRLIRSIVDTRNYLTHYDASSAELAVTGRELWVLSLKMEAIFQLHLLQVLGFTEEEVKSVLASSQELRQKLNET